MQDFLLLLAIAAMFAFGWFVMRKLDEFLAKNRAAVDSPSAADKSSLKIGLSNPLAADCLCDAITEFSKMKPEISVCLFSGTEDELVRKLSAHSLDVIFLPADAAIPEEIRDNAREALLSHTSVNMRYSGLPIEPIAKERVLYHVLWSESKDESAVSLFVECMVNEVNMGC